MYSFKFFLVFGVEKGVTERTSVLSRNMRIQSSILRLVIDDGCEMDGNGSMCSDFNVSHDAARRGMGNLHSPRQPLMKSLFIYTTQGTRFLVPKLLHLLRLTRQLNGNHQSTVEEGMQSIFVYCILFERPERLILCISPHGTS